MENDSMPPSVGDLPTLTPAQRKELKARAHHLDPVVMVGESGLTDAVIAEADNALRAHQLIKVRVFGDDRERRLACQATLVERLGCAPVQLIGKLLVLYRPTPEVIEDADSPANRRGKRPVNKKRLEARSVLKAKRRGPKPLLPPAKKKLVRTPAGEPASGTAKGAAGKAATARPGAPAARANQGGPTGVTKLRPSRGDAKTPAGNSSPTRRAEPPARGDGFGERADERRASYNRQVKSAASRPAGGRTAPSRAPADRSAAPTAARPAGGTGLSKLKPAGKK